MDNSQLRRLLCARLRNVDMEVSLTFLLLGFGDGCVNLLDYTTERTAHALGGPELRGGGVSSLSA